MRANFDSNQSFLRKGVKGFFTQTVHTRIMGRLLKAGQRAKILADWPIESNTAQWEKSYSPTLGVCRRKHM